MVDPPPHPLRLCNRSLYSNKSPSKKLDVKWPSLKSRSLQEIILKLSWKTAIVAFSNRVFQVLLSADFLGSGKRFLLLLTLLCWWKRLNALHTLLYLAKGDCSVWEVTRSPLFAFISRERRNINQESDEINGTCLHREFEENSNSSNVNNIIHSNCFKT